MGPDFESMPEMMTWLLDTMFQDATYVRYQRERMELIYEHLECRHSTYLEARYDSKNRRGKLRVIDPVQGRTVVETEVRAWR
jgi:hypothetical protein